MLIYRHIRPTVSSFQYSFRVVVQNSINPHNQTLERAICLGHNDFLVSILSDLQDLKRQDCVRENILYGKTEKNFLLIESAKTSSPK